MFHFRSLEQLRDVGVGAGGHQGLTGQRDRFGEFVANDHGADVTDAPLDQVALLLFLLLGQRLLAQP